MRRMSLGWGLVAGAEAAGQLGAGVQGLRQGERDLAIKGAQVARDAPEVAQVDDGDAHPASRSKSSRVAS